MCRPNDVNERIALAKGWIRLAEPQLASAAIDDFTSFAHPKTGRPAQLPDWVGTLEGVAELLKELSVGRCSTWCLIPIDGAGWRCANLRTLSSDRRFMAPLDQPGECVAKAYLSVHEKKKKETHAS